MIAQALAWLRFDPTPEREKEATDARLRTQGRRLRELAKIDHVRPAYSAAADRVERRTKPR